MALLGRGSGLRPLFFGREPVAHGLGARQWLCRLLEQLQQPLSASPGYLPRGQPPSWDRGAGLDQGGRVRVVRERLGDRTHLCADVVGLFLALHILSLQPILDLTHVMVYEYSRNDFRGQQARERTKEKGGYGSVAMSWVVGRTMRYRKRVIRSCAGDRDAARYSAQAGT